ncbi:hypothetical protein Tco_0912834 [Tanacetum coccineum]
MRYVGSKQETEARGTMAPMAGPLQAKLRTTEKYTDLGSFTHAFLLLDMLVARVVVANWILMATMHMDAPGYLIKGLQ